jgi:jumonji domain-containing protein 7
MHARPRCTLNIVTTFLAPTNRHTTALLLCATLWGTCAPAPAPALAFQSEHLLATRSRREVAVVDMDCGQLQRELVQAAIEAQELVGTSCPRVEKPTPAQFLRDFVLPNKPCVITGLMDDWPAMQKWSEDYMCACLGDTKVSINVTPNGRGDAITSDGYFAMPEERSMRFDEFLAKLHDKVSDEVCYLSHQNDNLRQQIAASRKSLMQDVPASICFVDEALGCSPDAVNLWVGDERAMTTLHKDHYENIYAVVQGSKIFTLYPPAALPLLYPRQCPPKAYHKAGDRWTLADSPYDEPGATRPWISVDPQAPDFERFPLFRHAVPTRVEVHRGEVLYLPAMWFHQVAQTDGTVAVNYWYDMVYGDRYVSHKLLERLVAAAAAQGAGEPQGEREAVAVPGGERIATPVELQEESESGRGK